MLTKILQGKQLHRHTGENICFVLGSQSVTLTGPAQKWISILVPSILGLKISGKHAGIKPAMQPQGGTVSA